MRRLKILIWHVHGSYLNALACLDHDWYLPLWSDGTRMHGGRGAAFAMHERLHEVPIEDVRQP